MGKYFVILHDQQGGAVAMTDDPEYGYSLALFESYDEAREAGENNIMGRACGFDVHELGGGCEAT